MKYKEFHRFVLQRGWVKVRQNGSHCIYSKEGRADKLIIPLHGSKEIPEPLRRSLIRQMGEWPHQHFTRKLLGESKNLRKMTERKKLIINICASSDSFGAYSESCEGIYGAGDTVAEAKASALAAIELLREEWPEDIQPLAVRENWPVEWRYDVKSLLNFYEGVITNAALERLTGINRKQLWNYAHGRSQPRKATVDKIRTALRALGQELVEVSM